ncbi:MAG: hypothetical protein AAF645_18450, partial [Myxococcota bacterium]
MSTASLIQSHLSHLRQLEAESIHIFREAAAEFERPVRLRKRRLALPGAFQPTADT